MNALVHGRAVRVVMMVLALVGGVLTNAGPAGADTEPPTTPVDARWVDGLGAQEQVSSGDETITGRWTSASDSGSGVHHYRAQVAETADFTTVVADKATVDATTQLTFAKPDGIAYDHGYFVRVAAVDGDGNTSGWSESSGRVEVRRGQAGPAVAHTPVATAYAGGSIPITARSTCSNVTTCSARLYYRRTLAPEQLVATVDHALGGGFQQVDMDPGEELPAPSGSLVEWTAAIPGFDVTATGIDYYLEAEDDHGIAHFPGSTYAGTTTTGMQGDGSFFHVEVVLPPLPVHVPPGYAYDGQDVPLHLDVACATDACAATVHHRTSTEAITGDTAVVAENGELLETPNWPTSPMTRTSLAPIPGGGFLAGFDGTVPSEFVDTRGVDYFIEITDDETHAWAPGSRYEGYYAPIDGMRTGYYHVHVLEQPHVVHAPVTTAPYRAPIDVSAHASCDPARPCTAVLEYRTTEASLLAEGEDFSAVPMEVTVLEHRDESDLVSLHGTIPASVVDTRGVDYRLFITDGTSTTWWPGTSDIDGYAAVPSAAIAYHHVRVLEPPHVDHQPPAAVPYGQQIVLNATVTCATEACDVTLHYTDHPSDVAATYHPVAMNRTAVNAATPAGRVERWEAPVPAAEVTTRGIMYYFEVRDGYTTAYAPGTFYWGAYLPMDGSFVGSMHSEISGTVNVAVDSPPVAYRLRVLEPPHVLHVPVATSYYGEPLSIDARANCATGQCAGTVHWRTSRHPWSSTTMVTAAPVPGVLIGDVWTFTAVIPGSDATTEGVDYWIEVTDGFSSDATPTIHTTVLAPTAVLHAPVLTSSPATAVPIDAVVPCATATCEVTLFFRIPVEGVLSEPAWSALPMTAVGAPVPVGQATSVARHAATIPADAVTTRGVDYVIKAFDGHTTAYSPGSAYTATQVAALDGTQVHYHHIHVLEPARVVHQPVVAAQPGDAVVIDATTNCATRTCVAELGYRSSPDITTIAGALDFVDGRPPFTETPMEQTVIRDLGTEGTVLKLTATIPSTAMGATGADYWFHVTDGTTNTYFPGTTYVSGAGSLDGTGVLSQHIAPLPGRAFASVGDLVWRDRDADGFRDWDEPGLQAVRFGLRGAGLDGAFGTLDDLVVGTATTDRYGAYHFNNLVAGRYRLTLDTTSYPADMEIASGSAVRDLSLTAGQAWYDGDVGLRRGGAISGRVWHDVDEDATADTAEEGQVGVSVRLDDPGPDGAYETDDDIVLAEATTSADGAYTFTDLAAGAYHVALGALPIEQRTSPTTLTASAVTLAANEKASRDFGFVVASDNDADGLIDQIEGSFGATAGNPDTDGDTLLDGWEATRTNRLHSPGNADTDGDGVRDDAEDVDGDTLTAAAEQAQGTSANIADTDDDGLSDGVETGAATTSSPVDADTDDDGLDDGSEARAGTNPRTADTDGDGVGDGSEVLTTSASGPAGVTAEITGVGDLGEAVQFTDMTDDVRLSGTPGMVGAPFDIHLAADSPAFQHATLTFPFPEGATAADMRVMWFDEAASVWVPAAENQIVDTNAHTVSATVSHFSIYGVFDLGDYSAGWSAEGVPCPARSDAEGNQRSIDVVLVIDRSASQATWMWQQKAIGYAVANSMISNDRAAVVAFNAYSHEWTYYDTSATIVPITSNVSQVNSGISSLSATGGSPIGTGVSLALGILEANARAGVARRIVLMSDGWGSYDPALTQRAVDDGIQIHTVGTGTNSQQQLLVDISEATGGVYHQLTTPSEDPTAMADVVTNDLLPSPDTDGDGLPDCEETQGTVNLASGERYTSSPNDADTDGDGLTDLEEVGPRVYFTTLPGFGEYSLPTGGYVRRLFSNPRAQNSDATATTSGDLLDDAEEADEGTLAFSVDSDADGLRDDDEVNLGLNPRVDDTDGDGFLDKQENDRRAYGFDPQRADHKTSKWDYADDWTMTLGFARGGDFDYEPTNANLNAALYLSTLDGGVVLPSAPNITVSVDIIMGMAIGDMNDYLLGSDEYSAHLEGDYVGDGFAAFGFDYQPEKYIGFGIFHPRRARDRLTEWANLFTAQADKRMAAEVIARTNANLYVGAPTATTTTERTMRLDSFGAVWGGAAYYTLLNNDFGDAQMIALAKGRTDFEKLAGALNDSAHVRYDVLMSAEPDAPEPDPGEFWRTVGGQRWWQRAQDFVADHFPDRITPEATPKKTWETSYDRTDKDCLQTAATGRPGKRRVVDHVQVVDHDDRDRYVFHEVKTGFARASNELKCQIRKDKDLIDNDFAQSAHWHFFPSGLSRTIGTADSVFTLLRSMPNQIRYTLYPGEVG